MKWFIFSLCVLVLFVAACNSPEASAPSPTPTTPSVPVGVVGGGDQKCVATQDGATSTFYLSQGKVQRVDVVHPTQGQSHILYQGDLVYQWVDGATKGMQFSLSQMQQMNARMQEMVSSFETKPCASY